MIKIFRMKSEWWFEPEFNSPRTQVPRDIKSTPLPLDTPSRSPRALSFKHSKNWVRFGLIEPADVGYLVPVYSLNSIAKRYGLSQSTRRYWRNHILPDPYTVVLRRGKHAHHWSKFTLAAIDVVLLDLQSKGCMYFSKRHEDHIDLVHIGSDFITDFYTNRYNEHDNIDSSFDELGVDLGPR